MQGADLFTYGLCMDAINMKILSQLNFFIIGEGSASRFPKDWIFFKA